MSLNPFFGLIPESRYEEVEGFGIGRSAGRRRLLMILMTGKKTAGQNEHSTTDHLIG